MLSTLVNVASSVQDLRNVIKVGLGLGYLEGAINKVISRALLGLHE